MTDEKKLDLAEELLGHRFKDRAILRCALTHPSDLEEGDGVEMSYERLEFLGDSIVGAIVANAIFKKFPHMDEGGMTRIKTHLVSGTNMADKASEMGLAECIFFGGSETGTGARGLHSALENVFEALTAALFLDGGPECARDFVLGLLEDDMQEDIAFSPDSPKSTLQEILQEKRVTPTYRIISQEGPPHNRTFVAEVLAGGDVMGSGKGRSKKAAEVSAALDALRHIGRSS